VNPKRTILAWGAPLWSVIMPGAAPPRRRRPVWVASRRHRRDKAAHRQPSTVASLGRHHDITVARRFPRRPPRHHLGHYRDTTALARRFSCRPPSHHWGVTLTSPRWRSSCSAAAAPAASRCAARRPLAVTDNARRHRNCVYLQRRRRRARRRARRTCFQRASFSNARHPTRSHRSRGAPLAPCSSVSSPLCSRRRSLARRLSLGGPRRRLPGAPAVFY
jgi:hypothetical protein